MMSRRWAMVPVLVLTVTVVAGCNPIFGDRSGPVRHGTLTTKNGETYVYAGEPEQVTVTPGVPEPYGSTREFFWKTEDPFYPDQQSCMTWDTVAFSQEGGAMQPGLAMRIAPSGPDGEGIRGITVNQNIVYGAMWIIWVNTWDTTRVGHPFQGVERFDLSDVVGSIHLDENGELEIDLVDAPWYVCARTMGLQLTFKLWTHLETEPGWDDPDHVFETTLPAGWDHAGYSGGYIGHLRPGQTAAFGDFTTTVTCLAPDLVDTPECRALLDRGNSAGHG